MPVLASPQPHVGGTTIKGIGAYRPTRIVTNENICQLIDSSDEWIRQRTGIVTRHRANENTSMADMAVEAAGDALTSAGMEPAQIGTVILATVTHECPTPSAATLIAERLGAHGAVAYDISAACAGYCYGIAQADGLIRSGLARYVLVIGAEKLSDFIDDRDRSMSFLLGDGAGAAVLGPSDEPGIGPTIWGSDGSKWAAVGLTHSWHEIRRHYRQLLLNGVAAQEDPQELWPSLRQDGQTVFRWAVWRMAEVAAEALTAAGVTVADLGAFVPHQANMRIVDALARELGLPPSVSIARDLAEAGNTSAASIPLATHRLLHEQPELSGTLCLQIGFGAGLAFAAQVVRLP